MHSDFIQIQILLQSSVFPERYPKAWHLRPAASSGTTMNIESAWRAGITGRGVNVVHIDSGIDYTHPDLRNNYQAGLSYDIAGNDVDALPSVNGRRHVLQ